MRGCKQRKKTKVAAGKSIYCTWKMAVSLACVWSHSDVKELWQQQAE